MSLPDPYYRDAFVTLYCGDCREILPQLERVEHVITDPPYSAKVHGAARRAGDLGLDGSGRGCAASKLRTTDLGFDPLSDELRTFCADRFADLCSRWCLVFSDVEMCGAWRADLEAGGLEYVRTGAWVKLGSTPQFTGDRPAVGFEAITIAHPKGRKSWNGGGGHAVWSVPIVLNRGDCDERRVHTTQKPLVLIQQLVALFTDPSETILDAFAGSGTTGVAARLAGRHAVLIERDSHYCAVAAKRLAEADRRGPVCAPELFAPGRLRGEQGSFPL